MDAERRLVRNEKARRRTALKYACRHLPIELEKEVFSYMKNPDNGRIDVSMKWQIHPIAKSFIPRIADHWESVILIPGLLIPLSCRIQKNLIIPWDNHIAYLARLVAGKRISIRAIKRTFVLRMQQSTES